MPTENWLQIIVGGIIITTLGFLSANVFDMKGTLSSVKTQVDATESRLSRIAETLPEVKAKVAWEEVNHAISGFVAVSEPIMTNGNRWLSRAAVYNRDSNNVNVYTVSLDMAHKDFVGYVVAGKVKTENPNDASFAELAAHSGALQQPVVIPSGIDANKSFVFRAGDVKALDEYLRSITNDNPSTVTLAKVRSWKELSEKLDTIEKITEPNNAFKSDLGDAARPSAP